MADEDLTEKLRYWRAHPGTFAGRLRRAGSARTTVVPHEADGRCAGTQTEHWDDRVDANVHLRPIVVHGKIGVASDGKT